MTTQNLIKGIMILVAVIGFGLTGCKKEKIENIASLQQLATDETDIQNGAEDVLNDANDVLSRGQTKELSSLPCGATIDSLIVNDTITYTLTFNGLNCNGNRYRTGQVKITRNVNDHWSTAGTTIRVEFINYRITRVLRNRTETLNGVKYVTNVSGGLVRNLGSGVTTVVHRVTGTMQATFDNNTTRTWNIARQRTFTGTPGQLILTTDGVGSANGYSNLSVWGINRNGEEFYVQIAQSVVHRQECGWDPVAGEKIYQIPADNKRADVTFGYDSNNQPVTGSNCPDRFRVDWEKNNHSGTIYIEM